VDGIKRGEWREVAGLSQRQQALCAVAEKLSATPTRMVKEDWQPLRDLGFDDRACLEVGHIVGIFNYLTRLADGFGLLLDRGTAEAGATGVALRRDVS
jgi:alkylhydroperoxidase family enzyme